MSVYLEIFSKHNLNFSGMEVNEIISMILISLNSMNLKDKIENNEYIQNNVKLLKNDQKVTAWVLDESYDFEIDMGNFIVWYDGPYEIRITFYIDSFRISLPYTYSEWFNKFETDEITIQRMLVFKIIYSFGSNFAYYFPDQYSIANPITEEWEFNNFDNNIQCIERIAGKFHSSIQRFVFNLNHNPYESFFIDYFYDLKILLNGDYRFTKVDEYDGSIYGFDDYERLLRILDEVKKASSEAGEFPNYLDYLTLEDISKDVVESEEGMLITSEIKKSIKENIAFNDLELIYSLFVGTCFCDLFELPIFKREYKKFRLQLDIGLTQIDHVFDKLYKVTIIDWHTRNIIKEIIVADNSEEIIWE